ncbi:MAG: PEP-CTERM sorting domain-containing protein, partial [Lacipirellulaceae bacterium]
GFDAASFEPANTGSGQAFTNGNGNTIVDLIADTINFSGVAGDIINLNYLLGSDSGSGTGSANSTVTLTLDAGLGSEQTITYATQTRTGTARDGSTDVSEVYVSTGAYSTIDLTLQMNPGSNSTRSLIDDVRLTVETIPEPTTLALIGLALASGGMVRRRS